MKEIQLSFLAGVPDTPVAALASRRESTELPASVTSAGVTRELFAPLTPAELSATAKWLRSEAKARRCARAD